MTAAGRLTGLAVNCGYQITSVTPVYEGIFLSFYSTSVFADVSLLTQGNAIPYATQVAKYGGIHLDDYLEKFMMDRGYAFRTSWDKETVTDMKVETVVPYKFNLTLIKGKNRLCSAGL